MRDDNARRATLLLSAEAPDGILLFRATPFDTPISFSMPLSAASDYAGAPAAIVDTPLPLLPMATLLMPMALLLRRSAGYFRHLLPRALRRCFIDTPRERDVIFLAPCLPLMLSRFSPPDDTALMPLILSASAIILLFDAFLRARAMP